MSYCRFQNTYHDLQDCYDNMENVSGDTEKKYRTRIIELCKDIINDFGDDEFNEEEDEER